MQTADQLNTEFTLDDLLRFDEPHPGMPRALIHTPSCTAELYLQGAHLTQWQPMGQAPVLFLSERSAFTPGKAIRGGVPVIFPWFGAPDRSPVHPAPGSTSHGYARIWPWTLRFAALAGDDLHLSLTLDHNDRLHALGYDFLQLGLDLIVGNTLTVRLTAANASTGPDTRAFLFEEALHAYFQVGAVDQVAVGGLDNTEYLDKPDDFRRKTQHEPEIRFTCETDRPYLNTESAVTLTDPAMGRRLVLTKQNSRTTVIWNPAAELTATLPDLDAKAWQHFVCMETANVAENAVTLHPGEAYTMSMHVAVEAQ